MTHHMTNRQEGTGRTAGGMRAGSAGERPGKVSGHVLLWGLLGLTGLGLCALAIVLLLSPPGPSPGEATGPGKLAPRPVPPRPAADLPPVSVDDPASQLAQPDPLPVTGIAPPDPRSATATPLSGPNLDFENAPGVLSISLRTRRRETLLAYPTEALGAIALGLEDLRLTPSNKSGQLAVNLGEQIRYEEKDHEVPKQSRRLLDGIGRLLAENPDTQVQIHSHTDDEGDAGFNLRLSQRRAVALKDYLVGRGVAPERIIAEGRGESSPLIAPGKRAPTRAERAKNRRTELVIEALEPPEQGPTEPAVPPADAATGLTAANPADPD